jgi:single-strand DNA-binding protein
MSDGMNKVLLLGNVGSEPELRQTSGGNPVLSFSLATNESYLDRDGKRQERTDWHRAVVWGKRAEALSRLLRKGSGVLIEGGLRTHSYEKEGQKHYRTEVHVRELCFTSSRAPADHAPADRASAEQAPADFPPAGDEQAKPSLIEPKIQWSAGPNRSRARVRPTEQPGLALSA